MERKYQIRLISAMGVVAVVGVGYWIALRAPAPPEVKALVQGGALYGANGIAFDDKDRLHIATVVGQEIVAMDPDSGDILDRIGYDQGVRGPDDLAFGPDGSLYWTSFFTGEVGRLSPDGVKTGQILARGVNPITFSDDGRLFVGLALVADGLYELDPNLVKPPRLVAEGFGGINAFDFGPDGLLYGPIQGLVRIDVDANPATFEKVAEPAFSTKFDSKGHLYSLASGGVVRIDPATGESVVVGRTEGVRDNLAFDSRDRLFVSHHDGGIVEVLPDGGVRTVRAGGLAAPGGVAVVPRTDGESVFVVDGGNTLREFDGISGEERSIWRGGFSFSASPDGDRLLLSSWFSNSVRLVEPGTRQTVERYQFETPLNAIRFRGDLIAAEFGSASVVRASGEDMLQRETLAEGLGVPVGLAATDEDVWVSDWAEGSILQIVADGEKLDDPVEVATDLDSPEGLAVSPDGSLLVVETGTGRLLSIDPGTKDGRVRVLAEGLEVGLPGCEGAPPTWILSGVAVGPSGAVYVTGDVGNVLYRIDGAVR